MLFTEFVFFHIITQLGKRAQSTPLLCTLHRVFFLLASYTVLRPKRPTELPPANPSSSKIQLTLLYFLFQYSLPAQYMKIAPRRGIHFFLYLQTFSTEAVYHLGSRTAHLRTHTCTKQAVLNQMKFRNLCLLQLSGNTTP